MRVWVVASGARNDVSHAFTKPTRPDAGAVRRPSDQQPDPPGSLRPADSRPHQSTTGRWRTAVVTVAADTAAAQLVGFLADRTADDDQLYTNHHRAQPAAHRHGHPGYTAQPGTTGAGTVPDLFHHGAGIQYCLRNRLGSANRRRDQFRRVSADCPGALP